MATEKPLNLGSIPSRLLRNASLESLTILRVAPANAASGDIVHVGRANSAPGSADGPSSNTITQDVPRQNEMCLVTDQQAGMGPAQPRFEGRELITQHNRVDYDAVADDAGLVRVKNSRGQQVKGVALVVHHHRMTCIVTALVTNHRREARLGGQRVNNLALALITPLSAQNHQVSHPPGSP